MAYGIDFGTSSCSVAVWEPGVGGSGTSLLKLDHLPFEWRGLDMEKVLPTALAFREDRFALGWAAKLSKDGEVRAAKRMLGGDMEYQLGPVTITATTETALFFAELKRRSAEDGHKVAQAVITVPANANGAQRLRTLVAAQRGGIHVRGLVNEPTAAALAFLYRLPADRRDGSYLVFDWGGGTLDITVVEHEAGVTRQKNSTAMKTTGGLEFDRRFRKLLVDKGAELLGSPYENARIERWKIDLTSDDTVRPRIGMKTFTISREEFAHSCTDLIDEAMVLVKETVSAYPGSIDHLVAVGGTSRIPAVRDALLATLHGQGLNNIAMLKVEEFNPLTAVAEGAAIASAMSAGELKSEALHSAVANDLGVEAERKLGSEERIFSVIVPRDTPTPFSVTQGYTLRRPIRLTVLEGDARLPVKHPSQGVLSSQRIWMDTSRLIAIDPPKSLFAGTHRFEIEFRYDSNSLLHIRVHSPDFGTLMDGPLLVDDSLPDATTWDTQMRLVRANLLRP